MTVRLNSYLLPFSRILIGVLALLIAVSSCSDDGGGGPTAPPIPTIDSILNMSISVYPRTGSPNDVSLKLDGSIIGRMVWSSGCPTYLGIPLCVGLGGSVRNVAPGSSHTLTFEVNRQTRTSITYELGPAGSFLVPSQNLVESIYLPARVVTLRDGQSTSWTFTVAK